MSNGFAARSRGTVPVLIVLLFSTLFLSCNLTGGIDQPETVEEKLSDAKAALDGLECEEAVAKLDAIQAPDPEIARLRGWASLCRAGATIAKIGKSLYSYNTNMTDLSVVGQLANALVRENDTKLAFIDEAIHSFQQMEPSTDRSLMIAIADMAKAAGYIAKYSSDGVKVIRTDISNSSCQSVNCTAANDTTCIPTMSNSDANAVGAALIDANTQIGSNAELGALKELASHLGASASSVTGAINRCLIVTQMVAN